MNKGIVIGIALCLSLLLLWYFGGKFIYTFKGWGGVILFSFYPFLAGIFVASFFYNSRNEVISTAAKTVLTGLSLLLLVWGIFLFS